jgi:hypothetical protein
MKLFTQLVLSSLLCNVAFCGVYQVAGPVTVTITLTERVWNGTLYPRDETGKEDKSQGTTDRIEYLVEAKDGSSKSYNLFGRKPITYKIGNREIIEIVNDSRETTGLTLLAVPFVDTDTAILLYSIYLYDTRSKEFLNEVLSINMGSAFSGSGSEVRSINADGETVSVAVSGSGSFETPINVSFGEFIKLNGLFTGGVSLKTYLSDPKDKTSVEAVGIPGASKISSLVGGVEGESFTGTISFGASKAVTVTSE